MRNIIFSKFSNERAEEFNIRTDIIEDTNGKKIVCKTACNKKGLSHLDNIFKYYMKLSKMYMDTNIQINKCIKKENVLEFEYIEGKTLEKKLDQLLYEKNYKEFFKLISMYVSYIKEGLDISVFLKTEQFKQVFGDIDVPTNLKAGSFNNIDLLFGNIIVNDKWNVIDYEWSFDFPVPFNFIIYRSFFYYFRYSNRNELLNDNIYEMFDINKSEIEIYERMENNFQKYILGNTVPIRNLSNNNLQIKEIFNHQNTNVQNLSIQVFYDDGDGMTEENSYIINIPQIFDRVVSFKINNFKNAKTIRIDPANEECLINNIKIFDITNGELIQYITNGVLIQENSILFNTNDPQIVLNSVNKNIRNIGIEFHISLISNSISNTILNIYNETQDIINKMVEELEAKKVYIENINMEKESILCEQKFILRERESVLHELDCINKSNVDMKYKIEELEQKNSKLEKQVEDIQINYNNIINSNSWKITKPIRSIVDKIKN